MEYLERKPTHPRVRECVAHFWAITASGPYPRGGKKVADLPDGHTEYVLNGSTPFSRQVVNRPDTGSINQSSLLYAQKRKASVIAITGDTDLFCIRFKPPGLYNLCGDSLHEVTEHAIEPRLVFGRWANELEERILSVAGFERRVLIAEQVLAKMLNGSRPADPVVLSMLDIIEETNGMVRVHEIEPAFNVSRRTLEAKFKDQVGLAVKTVCRIQRFNFFWKLKRRHPDAPTLQLALDCGFYDQSHFIRDFRSFTGDAPLSFLGLNVDILINSIPENVASERS